MQTISNKRCDEKEVEKWIEDNFMEINVLSDIGSFITNYAKINFDKEYFWKYEYNKIYNVSNNNYVLDSINKHNVDNMLLWHGTPYYNIKSLIENNFNEKSRKSKLGRGIYFTENSKVACNFSDPYNNEEQEFSGYILLCNVSLGNVYNVFGGENDCSKYARSNEYGSIKNNGIYQTCLKNDIIIKNIENNMNTRIPNGIVSKYNESKDECNSLTNEYVIFSNEKICIEYLIKFTRKKFIDADYIVDNIALLEDNNFINIYKDDIRENKNMFKIAYIPNDNINNIIYKYVKCDD